MREGEQFNMSPTDFKRLTAGTGEIMLPLICLVK